MPRFIGQPGSVTPIIFSPSLIATCNGLVELNCLSSYLRTTSFKYRNAVAYEFALRDGARKVAIVRHIADTQEMISSVSTGHASGHPVHS